MLSMLPWLEMPLTPNLCLQLIASDDEILKKHMPRFAACKVFESRDLMGRSYICLQVKQMETLLLYAITKDSSASQVSPFIFSARIIFRPCHDHFLVSEKVSTTYALVPFFRPFNQNFRFLENCSYDFYKIWHSHSTPKGAPVCAKASKSCDWDLRNIAKISLKMAK